jgi:hypothetical protein
MGASQRTSHVSHRIFTSVYLSRPVFSPHHTIKETSHGENPRGFSPLTQSQPPRPIPMRPPPPCPAALLHLPGRHPPSPPSPVSSPRRPASSMELELSWCSAGCRQRALPAAAVCRVSSPPACLLPRLSWREDDARLSSSRPLRASPPPLLRPASSLGSAGGARCSRRSRRRHQGRFLSGVERGSSGPQAGEADAAAPSSSAERSSIRR